MTQRVTIKNGRFVDYYEASEMPGSFIRKEHAVLSAEGVSPSEVIWDSPGTIHAGGRIVLGSPEANWLFEVTISVEPTEDSDRYFEGYRAGFTGKRSIKGRCVHFMDGWQDGKRDRKSAH
jgi:hypothetical protein